MAETKLQEFREKNPQYEDWSDEDLVDAIREKHYADWDPADFNASMGIEAPAEPPPEPSMWERVKSRFTGNSEDPLSDDQAPSDESNAMRISAPGSSVNSKFRLAWSVHHELYS